VSVGGDDSPGGDIGVEKKRCDAVRPVVVLSQLLIDGPGRDDITGLLKSGCRRCAHVLGGV
jgi:hypothetical protein